MGGVHHKCLFLGLEATILNVYWGPVWPVGNTLQAIAGANLVYDWMRRVTPSAADCVFERNLPQGFSQILLSSHPSLISHQIYSHLLKSNN
jgi:hypothetical protein